MTKQQMLDIINLKMAPTSQSDEGTGCFLPITFKDVVKELGNFNAFEEISLLWKNKELPLHDQSTETISYFYLKIKDNNTYRPTQQELIELGFIPYEGIDSNDCYYNFGCWCIYFIFNEWKISHDELGFREDFNPSSMDDIKYIVRVLTPITNK